MNKWQILIVGVVAICLVVIGGGMLFTVDQTKQAIVLQFGELRKVHTTPGLKVKILLFKMFYIMKNGSLILIFLRCGLPRAIKSGCWWRMLIRAIALLILFVFSTVKPANEQGASMRLEAFVTSTVRNVFGKGAFAGFVV